MQPNKLFVANISFEATEEMIRALFEDIGTVEDLYYARDQESGRPRGFAFITMATAEEAEAAIEKLNGHLVNDRDLRVSIALPKEERPNRGGDRGGFRGPPRGDRGGFRGPPRGDRGGFRGGPRAPRLNSPGGDEGGYGGGGYRGGGGGYRGGREGGGGYRGGGGGGYRGGRDGGGGYRGGGGGGYRGGRDGGGGGGYRGDRGGYRDEPRRERGSFDRPPRSWSSDEED